LIFKYNSINNKILKWILLYDKKISFLYKYHFCIIKDAAGIVTCGNKGRLYQCKANGMVKDVFNKRALMNLVGSMGIGHGNFIYWKYVIFIIKHINKINIVL